MDNVIMDKTALTAAQRRRLSYMESADRLERMLEDVRGNDASYFRASISWYRALAAEESTD